MTTLNHALWGANSGRLVGMPIQGAVAGSVSDLLTIPILGVYHCL